MLKLPRYPILLVLTLCFFFLKPTKAEPDPRYKTDLLLIIGHPDDETFINGYLARVAFDQHKRISVIVCNTGEAGGNVNGPESGASLGYLQIVENRKALASLGIDNVWFVSGKDTPGQNVLWSLENWNHGRVLGEVVRLVRLTRPEVVLSMLPLPVAGENHGDHQAAGVIATEAFDLAGDPTAFPEQIAAARALHGVGNLTEGLRPWQAKKLYYLSDAFDFISQYWSDQKDVSPFRTNFLKGNGPEYSNTEISPAKKVSYAQLAAIESSAYLSQDGIGGTSKTALEKGNLDAFRNPVRLIFGKSLVGGTITGDVFAGVTGDEAAFSAVSGYRPNSLPTLRFGSALNFYAQFWRAHDIERIGKLLPVPELAVGANETLVLPLIFLNQGSSAVEVTLKPDLPAGWVSKEPAVPFRVEAHASADVQAVVVAPPSDNEIWQELHWSAYINGSQVGTVTMRALTGKHGLPQ
ncbi:MAG TPA: PIG-L family deacetylase [Terriglobales bacterium]|nr:PIG-L family deacetylase [Terriglobales bacterium]